jgi:hypothetical protein
MCTLHIRGGFALGRLYLHRWVGLIPKETSFIDSAIRQTPHTETVSSQLKGQDNITKQRKPTSMARSNKKMTDENQCMRLICKACAIYTIHTLTHINHIQHVPKRREKTSSVYRAQWHQGEACSGTYGLRPMAKE